MSSKVPHGMFDEGTRVLQVKTERKASIAKTMFVMAALFWATGWFCHLFADTLTWIGPTGNSGSPAQFTAEANWSSDGLHSSPKPGDTVVFDHAEKTEVHLADETFDLGASAFTLQINRGLGKSGTAAKVFSRVKFTGAGKLVKTGTGSLYFKVATGDWTGGFEVQDGAIYDNTGSTFTNYGDKDAPIILKAASDDSYPMINAGGWQTLVLKNPIQIVSPSGGTPRTSSSQYTFSTSSLVTYAGATSADGDFVIRAGDTTGYVIFSGAIAASGHTVHVFASGNEAHYGYVRFDGAIDANLEVNQLSASASKPHSRVILRGVSPNAANVLTINSGTNEFFDAEARWGGLDIRINPGGNSTSARLKLRSAANISSMATITARRGGFLEIPTGITVKVASLVFDDEPMPLGDYTGISLDGAFIQGGGTLQVVGTRSVWLGTGADATDWNDADNWSPAVVPSVGSTVAFEKDATISTALSFGEGDLAFDVAQGKKVVLKGAVSGAVKLVKQGLGSLRFGTNAGTWSGGTEVRNGSISDDGSASITGFGVGPVVLKPDSDTSYPYVTGAGWSKLSFTNQVLIITDPTYAARTASNSRSILAAQLLTVKGPISSDGDFVLTSESNGGQATYSGTVSAPGKTLYCYAGGTTDYSHTTFSGEIDASFVADRKYGNTWSEVRFSGRSTNAVNSLAVRSGTVRFMSADACWGGTNVVINSTGSGADPLLKVVSANNLSTNTALRVRSGGKIDIPEGVTLVVNSLTIDDADVFGGRYTKADFGGELIVGDGVLRVKSPKRGCLLLIR